MNKLLDDYFVLAAKYPGVRQFAGAVKKGQLDCARLLELGSKMQKHKWHPFSKRDKMVEAVHRWLTSIWFTPEIHEHCPLVESWWASMGAVIQSLLLLIMATRFQVLMDAFDRKIFQRATIPDVYLWLYDLSKSFEGSYEVYQKYSAIIADNHPTFVQVGTHAITDIPKQRKERPLLPARRTVSLEMETPFEPREAEV